MEHYRKTGYPLAVKLGTITPNGADFQSYDEDDMVLDPIMAEHLSHFGWRQTDKTELVIERNQRFGEWELIQESGSHSSLCLALITQTFGAWGTAATSTLFWRYSSASLTSRGNMWINWRRHYRMPQQTLPKSSAPRWPNLAIVFSLENTSSLLPSH